MVYPLPPKTELRCGPVTYVIESVIGRGGTSIVYSAKQEGTEAVFAIKEAVPYMDEGLSRENLVIQPKGDTGSKDREEQAARLSQCRQAVKNEAKIGSLIKKPSSRAISIWSQLPVYEIVSDEITATGQETEGDGPDGSVFCILDNLEKKGQFLSQIIERRRKTNSLFSAHELALIIQKILEALTDIHGTQRGSRFYLHGDLCAGNIFFEHAKNEEASLIGEAFLTDFGCAREVTQKNEETGELETEKLETVFTSPRYMAPEMMAPHPILTRKVDIYAVGCILLELMEFLPEPGHDLYWMVGESDFIRHGASLTVAKKFCAFLRGCLEEDPEKRLDLSKALKAATALSSITEPPKYKLSPNLTLTSNWVKGSREEELKRLQKELAEGKKPVWIWGFGGVGKSELARKLGQEQAKQNIPAYFITFKGSMKNTILTLDFEGYTEEVGASEEKRIKDKIDILRRYYENALFILDNYDPDTAIVDMDDDEKEREKAEAENQLFQTFLGLPFQVVITTRSRPDRQTPELKELSEYELLKLFRSCAPEEEASDQDVLNLIRAVEGHPLTVMLMASTIAASWSPLTVADLLERSLFQDSAFPAVVSDKDREQKRARISEHLRKLFQVAALSENQKRVLCHASLLPENGMNAGTFWYCESSEERSALSSLESHSFLRKADSTLSVHPLIREVTKNELLDKIGMVKGFLERLMLSFDRLNDPWACVGAEISEKTLSNRENIYFIKRQIAETVGNAIHWFQKNSGEDWQEINSAVLKASEMYFDVSEYSTAMLFADFYIDMLRDAIIPDFEQIVNAYQYAGCKCTIWALLYPEQSIKEKLVFYYTSALAIIKEKKELFSTQELIGAYCDLGFAYLEIQDLNKTEMVLNKAIQLLSPEETNSKDICKRIANLAINLTKELSQKDHARAKEWIQKIQSFVDKSGLIDDSVFMLGYYWNVLSVYGHLGDEEKYNEYLILIKQEGKRLEKLTSQGLNLVEAKPTSYSQFKSIYTFTDSQDSSN